MKEQIKFGICAWCLPENTPYDRLCACTENLELDGIELDLGKWEDDLPLSHPAVVSMLCEQRAQYGIAFPALSVRTLCTHPLSQRSDQRLVRQILVTAADTASRLEIPLLVLPSFEEGAIRCEEDFVSTAENLQYACTLCAKKGIAVGTENALSDTENFRLLRMTDRENIRCCFSNSRSVWDAGLDAPALLPRLKYFIAEYHCQDEDETEGKRSSVPLGTGKSKVAACIDAMKATHFHGWVQLENTYRGKNGETQMKLLKADVRILRNLVGYTWYVG